MMEIKITEYNAIGGIESAKSADGRFEWFDVCPEDLLDTIIDKSIYRMSYTDESGHASESITDPDMIGMIKDFRASLRALQDAEKRELAETKVSDGQYEADKHLCPKCDTFCHGDCDV